MPRMFQCFTLVVIASMFWIAGLPPICPADDETGALGTVWEGREGIPTKWVYRNPRPTGATLHTVTYGKGIFLASGEQETLLRSSDALHWQKIDVEDAPGSMAYGNKVFVGTLFVDVHMSTDGIKWKPTLPNCGFCSINFGGGKFIAGAGHFDSSLGKYIAVIWRSNDGQHWKNMNENKKIEFYLGHTVIGNNIVIAQSALSYDQSLLISRNGGSSWEKRQITFCSEKPGGIAFGNGLFAVTCGGDSFTSVDGVNWKRWRQKNPLPGILEYAHGNFFALGSEIRGEYYTSANGADWKKRSTGLDDDSYRVAFGRQKYVMVGDSGSIITSSDLTDWQTLRKSVYSGDLSKVVFGNGVFVALGEGGKALRSEDGRVWRTTFLGSSYVRGISFAKGRFYAFVSEGFYTSRDGKKWLKTELQQDWSVENLAFGNNRYVGTGWFGEIFTSSDGKNWSQADSGTTESLNDVTYGKGVFVTVGWDDTLLYSVDGQAWQPAEVKLIPGSTGVGSLYDVIYAENLFVAVGWGKIFTSFNGKKWNQVEPISNRCSSQQIIEVAHGNGVFLALGDRGCVYYSSDGKVWETFSDPTAPEWMNSLTAGNNSFVAVGDAGAIIQSSLYP